MSTNRQGIDDAGAIEGTDFTPEELAQIEQMQRDNPMPTEDEGGPAPADAPAEPGAKPPQKADAGDADLADDLEEGETEITIDEHGRGHDKNGNFVSKSALLRVKEQNKTLRAEREAERAARAKLEGRFELLAEALNAQPAGDGKAAAKKPANPWDEPDIDPVTDIFAAFDQQKRRNEHTRRQHETATAAQGQTERQRAMLEAYKADARRVAADNIQKGEMVTVGEGANVREIPAFHAAYLHVVAMRHAQLEAVGVADQAKRDALIAQEEGALIEESIAAKRSPAEVIMALAKASGFKVPTKGATNGNGQQKTQKQIEAEKHLEQVNNGMRSSQSLSGKGGNKPADGYSAQQLMEMSEDQLAEFITKVGGEEKFAKMYLGAE